MYIFFSVAFVSFLILGIYEIHVKKKQLSLLNNIGKLKNEAIRDKLLKEKVRIEKREELISTIYVVAIVIIMVYATLML